MSHRENITRIKAVYAALDELATQVVFIGGATVSLYSTRPAIETRPTNDVDVVIEILDYNQYSLLEEKLRSKGLINDLQTNIICRYAINGIVVDIMPTSEKILGFTNKWYAKAFLNSIQTTIDHIISIRIFSAPYFLATKMEAFHSRGENDGRTSSDFEDIVYILNNRESIWQELNNTDDDVKEYLRTEFAILRPDAFVFF